MDSEQIGGIVALLIFLVLPVTIGLIAIIYAKSFVRHQLLFLSSNDVKNIEPGREAIARYRLIGGILIALPIIIILIGVLVSLNQRPW